MLLKLNLHIAENFPFLKGKKILIAISGGLDSVVLSQLFYELGFSITLAHCNFQLREKESDLDAAFVQEFAKKRGIALFIKKIDTHTYAKKHKLSTQVAARNLRYTWFSELTNQHKLNFIATAHHANDNLETFLINLSRGTGLDGLLGIPENQHNIIRPLLPFSRKEIETFAIQNSLTWREDKSNSETKYLRNKIRHQITPILKELNPSILDAFRKTILNLHDSKQIVQDRIDQITPTIVSKENEFEKINIATLLTLSNPKAYLYQLLNKYGFTEWNDIANLMLAQSGKKVLSKTHQLLKNRDFLILTSINELDTTSHHQFLISAKTTEINTPFSLKITRSENRLETSQKSTKNSIYLDADLLQFPLIVRKWKHGDVLYPTGMMGKKKISKYFKDQKLSLLEKEQSWLLCNADNTIIWIVNQRQDRRFLASDSTQKIVNITIQ